MSVLTQLQRDKNTTEQELSKAKESLKQQQAVLEEKHALLQENLNKQKDIQKYKNDYEHLRKQLTLVEADLKAAYEKYQSSIEPDFMRKRELEFIIKKLKKLRKERHKVMKLLKREYNVRTKYNNASYRLHQTNNEYINNQSKLIKQNKNELKKTVDDFHYKKRIIGVNDYNVNIMDRKLNIAITGLSFILVGIVPTVLAFMKLVSAKLAIISVIVLVVVCLIVISVKYKPVANRSKRIWELRNFKEPEDKKHDAVIKEEATDVIVAEDSLSIEDVLGAKLLNAAKCKS